MYIPDPAHPVPVDLSTFIISISSAAFMGLGILPQFQTQKREVNLFLAKQNIDLLELLQQKTQGNRTPEEDQLLSKVLFETRMKYIEVQQLQQAAAHTSSQKV